MIDQQWMQGCLLDPNACRDHISSEDVTADDILIVISQSCDIVCTSYESEPYIELHVGRPIDTPDGNNSHGKNPRVLDIETTINGEARVYRIQDHERKKLPRQILETTTPVGALPEADTYSLANWTGNRYRRPALPDAFNARRAKAKDGITKLLKMSGKDLMGVYVALDTFDELPPEKNYQVALLTVTPTEIANNAERFQNVIDVTAKIEKLLKLPGIVVLEAVAKPSSNVSLDDIRYFKRLEFDYISTRDGGVQALD